MTRATFISGHVPISVSFWFAMWDALAATASEIAAQGAVHPAFEAEAGWGIGLSRNRSGIRVNAICPGLFMTHPNREWAKKNPEVIRTFVSSVPMGRAGEPEELGGLAVFLASEASFYVTGAAYVIDGGYTVW